MVRFISFHNSSMVSNRNSVNESARKKQRVLRGVHHVRKLAKHTTCRLCQGKAELHRELANANSHSLCATPQHKHGAQTRTNINHRRDTNQQSGVSDETHVCAWTPRP